ncbi:MAG TPA: hypothetical protein VNF48_03510 [Gammaproteobacteria bacterium]|nr:hypothetical protein [Gammaproteobacteria bacterium]
MKRIAILILLLGLPLLAQAADPRILNTDIPASGFDAVAISAGVGELHITPSTDDAVHVQVSLEQKSSEFLWFFHWQSRATAQEIQSAQITQQQQGQQLILSLTTPGKLSNDDVKQKWDVQVPARMAVDLNMKVGEATIDGVAGGVQVTLNVGELNVDIPRGVLNAKINVGQISVTTGTSQPGNIALSSNIGEAALYMHGKHIKHVGEHSGLGSSVNLNGSGHDSMNLSVNIGEVDLRVESSAKPSAQP